MDQNHLTQEQLAKAAGVSQATVSRALGAPAIRTGAARRRLFDYARIDEWNDDRQPDGEATQRVLSAFERIWDHSEAHANAIIRIIHALAGLRPVAKK